MVGDGAQGTVVGTTTSGGRPPRPRVPDSLRARSKYFAISTARGEHFFQAPTPAEWRKWTFYLLLASGKLPDDRCTPTERVLKPLSVHKGSDLARPEFAELRDAPVLQFSKEPLGQPLTTLPDAALEQQALALSKSIHLCVAWSCLPAGVVRVSVGWCAWWWHLWCVLRSCGQAVRVHGAATVRTA